MQTSELSALAPGDRNRLLSELDGWSLVDDHHLFKSFMFPDFRTALDFTSRVGDLAEQEAHHPDLHLSWGKVDVEVYTHKIDALTENDFRLAAKIDSLP